MIIFDIDRNTIIDGRKVSQMDYNYYDMGRRIENKKECLYKRLDQLCHQDLSKIHPNDRKCAILNRIKLIEQTEEELRNVH